MDHERGLKDLERRRRRAARLFSAGSARAEVARCASVSRPSVSHWEKLPQEGYGSAAPIEAIRTTTQTLWSSMQITDRVSDSRRTCGGCCIRPESRAKQIRETVTPLVSRREFERLNSCRDQFHKQHPPPFQRWQLDSSATVLRR